MKLLAIILGVTGAFGLSIKHKNKATDQAFKKCNTNGNSVIDQGEEENCIIEFARSHATFPIDEANMI